MRFFPLVFSLFMFILISNLVGLIPYSFTVTSHIIVTAALALLVFFTVVIVGVKEHGLHFFKLFVPSGVPIYILPLVVAIEIISFLSRPLSHSVRLFANMLAGHITLNVFGGFVVMLLGAGGGAEGGCDPAVRDDDRPLCARIARRFPAGLCVHHADLHVSQRRASSRPLIGRPFPNQSRKTQELRMEAHELATAAKYIGAGLAAIGTGAAGIGVGTLFGQFLNGALRNPSAVEGQFGRLIFGFAVTEALGIFALLIAFLLLFAV